MNSREKSVPCSAKRGKPQGKSGGRREISGMFGAHRTAQSFRGSLRLPVISTPACAAPRNDTPYRDGPLSRAARARLPADNPVAALTCHLSCHSLPRLRFAYPQRESQGRFVPCAKQQFICIFHPFRTQNEPPFRAAHLRFLGDYLYISGFSMVSTGRNWEVPREAFRASPATHAT